MVIGSAAGVDVPLVVIGAADSPTAKVVANAIGALVATIATASQKASARFVYELFINHSSSCELETEARPMRAHCKISVLLLSPLYAHPRSVSSELWLKFS